MAPLINCFVLRQATMMPRYSESVEFNLTGVSSPDDSMDGSIVLSFAEVAKVAEVFLLIIYASRSLLFQPGNMFPTGAGAGQTRI